MCEGVCVCEREGVCVCVCVGERVRVRGSVGVRACLSVYPVQMFQF